MTDKLADQVDVRIFNAHESRPVWPQYHVHHPFLLNLRADLAFKLIQGHAMCIGEQDSKDTINLLSAAAAVRRACDIADLAYAEFENRGWLLPVPGFDEIMGNLEGRRTTTGFAGHARPAEKMENDTKWPNASSPPGTTNAGTRRSG